MSYSTDISSMLLGDLELFPECLLPSALKDEVGDLFNEHPQQPKGLHVCSSQSIHDDPFPDWLDLKMDLSFLDRLETTENVLNDLLQSETDVGQSMDVLQALQVEDDTSFPPLNLKHIPSELVSENVNIPQEAGPLCSEVDSPTTSPPSSPECLVPEISPDSPAYLSSSISSPRSPDCTLTSRGASPALADTTFIAFVAPLVQPISASSSTGVQCLPLDVVHWSVVLSDQEITPIDVQSDLSSPSITSLTLAKNTARPKKDCKRKATNPKKDPVNPKKFICDDIVKPSSIPTSKKDRKRQQNKDAALRYRLKKRMETDTVTVEENQLLEENKVLREKAQQLANELGYLKKLMREMFKTKGLLK